MRNFERFSLTIARWPLASTIRRSKPGELHHYLGRNRVQARELFVPPELMEDYIHTSAHISKATLLAAVGDNMRFELPAAWSEFRGPALVMVGRRERALMRDSAAVIHTALPASEIEIVNGCGHGIPLERPDWFNGRVAGWLPRQ